MGVTDVPQWLPAAFVRSALAAGATAPREEIEATCHRLLDRWQESDRHFHNCKHLIDMLARVDELAEETHHPDMVRLAAWYHGAVFSAETNKAYARSGGEDEVASAELAREELGRLGVPVRALERIAELIVGLKRHEIKTKDIDCLALSDADLSILAADPQRYKAYRNAVRAEYAHLPARHYLEARIAIVSKLLARRDIFVSPMGHQWEDAARENLMAERDRLGAELAAMGETGPEGSVAAAEAEHEVVDDASQPDGNSPRVFEPTPVRGAQDAPGDSALQAGPGESGAENATERSPSAGEAPASAAPAARRDDDASASAPTPQEPERVTKSSLESLPEDIIGRGRPDPDGERAAIGRSSRDLVDQAVRDGRADRERAARQRRGRDRLDAARSARESDRLRERPTRKASPLTPTSAPTPDRSAERRDRAADREGRAAARETRAADRPRDGEPTTGEQPTLSPPQHGIEREPDYFTRPRKKSKDSKRDKPRRRQHG
ncbi:hypothetical protein GCM10023169_00340 [Georgenia halophila]|uniref:Metal-dependent HD superfamily phosphohydrolase n=1 Tax=Georgenia halophila TaxID=620889 RepID=A0ABP8KTU5_9MICO